MDAIITKAKVILSNIFRFDVVHFERHTTRLSHIMEGRRFLIYFMRQELEITYMQIIKFVPALTNHVTAIHHFNKMRDILEFEKSTIEKYEDFKRLMLENPEHLIENKIVKYTDKRKQINNEIYKLKKLL